MYVIPLNRYILMAESVDPQIKNYAQIQILKLFVRCIRYAMYGIISYIKGLLEFFTLQNNECRQNT